MLVEDCDNELLLGHGDVVECLEKRNDMMKVKIPGTGISSWLPSNALVIYN